MNRVAIGFALGALLIASPALGQQAKNAEEAAVRAAVQHYLLAHATGDAGHIRTVFHPELKLFFARDGKLMTRSGAEYMAGFSGQPAADEAARKRWIESVDITGTAAVVKVVLDYPSARLTDYFQLVKGDGEWKIVSKIFSSAPKTAPGGN